MKKTKKNKGGIVLSEENINNKEAENENLVNESELTE